MGGSLPGGSTRSGRAPLCACVRPAGAGRVNRAEEEGHFRLAYDAPGQPDVRLSRRIATGGAGCGRGVPWRESGSKRDRGTEGSQRGKRTMAVRIGRTERRKERSCGRSRCVQDNAGRLQRLTGDNVRPLMRPAQRREEAQGGSTQRGAWERIREGRPQSGRSDAHKKSPCSFLQGRNMVGHQGLEPRTN